MSVGTADRYVQLCNEFNVKPIQELTLLLSNKPSLVDISCTYFPRLHLPVVLALVQERSDMQELILDEAHFSEADIELIASSLIGSHVHTISLKKVKMNVRSGERLKQLCMKNSRITHMKLEGTMLPQFITEAIDLLTDMNRLQATINANECQPAVFPEVHKEQRLFLEMLPGSATRSVFTPIKATSTKDILTKFMKLGSAFFCDEEFGPENSGIAGNVLWLRIHELCADATTVSTCCRGISPIIPSKIFKSENLCACLNVLQQHDTLRKNTLKVAFADIGLYTFRFFFNGNPVEISIDDRLPCFHEDDCMSVMGIHSDDRDYWGALLEKALAKLIGGYNKLEKVSFGEMLSWLTGGTCFDINWTRGRLRKTDQMFYIVREFLCKKRILICKSVPRNEIARAALIERGIRPELPYSVLGTDMCHEKEGRVIYLVQIAAPHSNSICKDAFVHNQFQESQINGFSIFWIQFEYFATFFENVFLLMWPYDDPLLHRKKTISLATTGNTVSSTSSSFASNYSMCIENLCSTEISLILSFEQREAAMDENISSVFHFHKLPSECSSTCIQKRYDICAQNALFSTSSVSQKDGAILFRLRPRERMQVTLSGTPSGSRAMNISSLDDFSVFSLPNKCSSLMCSGKWDTKISNVRTPSMAFLFRNASDETVREVFVALAQEDGSSRPFAVSVVGWQNVQHESSDVPTSPHFFSERVCKRLAVFKLTVEVLPYQSLILMPCSHDDFCPDSFDFTVFCEQSLIAEQKSM